MTKAEVKEYVQSCYYILIHFKNIQKHSYIAGGSINWYCLYSVALFIKINPVIQLLGIYPIDILMHVK